MKDKTDAISAIIDDDDNPAWLVTYADLVTLLLVFFVLLFSISNLNLEKFKYAIRSIQINLGESDPAGNFLELIESQQSHEEMFTIDNLISHGSREAELLKDIDQVIREETVGDNIVLQISEGRICMMIKGKALFDAGEAELNTDAIPVMYRIAKLITAYPEYSVNIKGYTDNVPISTLQFPSNWELSAIRATTVLKCLVKYGINPERLTATGYGELMPIAPNDTEENRARNRRVEFVLEKKEG